MVQETRAYNGPHLAIGFEPIGYSTHRLVSQPMSKSAGKSAKKIETLNLFGLRNFIFKVYQRFIRKMERLCTNKDCKGKRVEIEVELPI